MKAYWLVYQIAGKAEALKSQEQERLRNRKDISKNHGIKPVQW